MPDNENMFFSVFNERRQGDDRRILVLNLINEERRDDGKRRQTENRRQQQREEFRPHHCKLVVLAAWLEENCQGDWYISSAGSEKGNYRVGFDNRDDFENFTIWRGIKSSLRQTDS